jgi:hypothetical protein
MEVVWDDVSKTWSTRPLRTDKKFSRSSIMAPSTKYIIVGALFTLFLLGLMSTGPRAKALPTQAVTCPRGYYYRAPSSTWAGWERPCIPIGEESSLDGIPAAYLS